VARAEVALDDYDAEKAVRRPWLSRNRVGIAFWVFLLTCLAILWKMLS
jgi:hypothetical protein